MHFSAQFSSRSLCSNPEPQTWSIEPWKLINSSKSRLFLNLLPEAFWELLFSLLLPLLGYEPPLLLVMINGFHKLEATEKQVLGNFLGSCQNHYPWFRFLLLSRPEGGIDKIFSLLQVETVCLTGKLLYPILNHVRHRLDSWGSLRSHETASDVRETMTRKA